MKRMSEEKNAIPKKGLKEDAARIGYQTPTELFSTFPLANEAQREKKSGEAIPSEADVFSVKNFVDENEK